ncbi:tRNA1(Val) (adenine(37)-N6)-methyltransferase [Maribacter cobaltidurans]|uniref:tRNA1(Val) (adenine(37)-N6)-methyltransferase n=1 Tax=Maribacter cobaltidurans TaxID=1178778 RepID=A0A223V2Y4_9FLAO|nr:methyltransferase [Maribacter cobaltidurans]ASV29682.1 tRNA (adenine-N(6)-)-methyltransferase [Maribacter cobaltidurans]GGD66801.1 tRNA1(Val) (adenine(37)-N6)-methyltransferase [Maribacter cobaltidurans]
MNKPFKFKQFTVHQDRCGMKIGTDGVLLGAWTAVEQELESILDIGAGTGIISLMLAQRSDAPTIDAIEIDADAYEQCVDNFEASPWGNRLYCYHAGLDEFVDEIDDRYDLIISNPPFYSEAVASGDVSRDLARQNSALPFKELLQAVSILLSDSGIFSVIIPYKEETEFLKMAANFGLFPKRVTHIRGHMKTPFKRSLIEFSRTKEAVVAYELTIEKERHSYTQEYIDLTQDFYLKM